MGRYKISGVPICNALQLVGIITNTTTLLSGSDFDQKIENVMTKDHLVTAPGQYHPWDARRSCAATESASDCR